MARLLIGLGLGLHHYSLSWLYRRLQHNFVGTQLHQRCVGGVRTAQRQHPMELNFLGWNGSAPRLPRQPVSYSY